MSSATQIGDAPIDLLLVLRRWQTHLEVGNEAIARQTAVSLLRAAVSRLFVPAELHIIALHYITLNPHVLIAY